MGLLMMYFFTFVARGTQHSFHGIIRMWPVEFALTSPTFTLLCDYISTTGTSTENQIHRQSDVNGLTYPHIKII
jgi:hypothetical protein